MGSRVHGSSIQVDELPSGQCAFPTANFRRGAHGARVKRFAHTMVEDHQKSGEELEAMATSKGVEVPGEPSLLQRATRRLQFRPL
ncbi:DUF4142 domain-containing protein [Hydrogenophaga sp.]|uniref:DUF4142 domain-containing protein n=1 Tax=Hydrogenophaga sp. TaxID=1904254 RepID=UPI003F6EB8FF